MRRRIFFWGQKTEGQSSAAPCFGKDNPPEKWGPPLWKELHERPGIIGYKSFEYGEPQNGLRVKHYVIDRGAEVHWLLGDFVQRIPCPECREHFLTHLILHPLPRRNADYAAWTVEYHNVVNAKLGKPRWRAPEKSPA